MPAKPSPLRVIELPRGRPKAETPFLILCSFLSTFVIARIVVSGLYEGWWKLGGFLYVEKIHIHHYFYGILLLAVGGFLSLIGVGRRRRWTAAIFYGVGLGLTVDEFAMWLRLEDDYYNRLSYDAVVVVAAVFLLIATFGAFRDRLNKRRQTKAHSIPTGTVLFREGETGDEAYYILEGRVRVSKKTAGGSQTLAHIGPGEFVGELALFVDGPRSATAEAEENLLVRRLNRKNLFYRMEVSPELTSRLIRTLAQRLIATSQQVASSPIK